MTAQEQQQYSKTWHQFQLKKENQFTKKFEKALKLQVEAYIKTQDLMSVPAFPIYTVLTELYTTVGPQWARMVRMDTNEKALGQMSFNEQIVQLMQQYYGIDLLNDAQGITEYTRQVIMKVLQQAAQEGWGIDEIVRQLTASSELGGMRARRIARTETVTAANGAAMIYAQTSMNVMDKIWIAATDNRTRQDHVIVNGTKLPIDEPFQLASGSVEMMQPGARQQPNGLNVPADQVVNCRCAVGFRARRDANGKIIRRV